MDTLYTIGYAGKTIDEFIKLLKGNGVTCLVDVRSMPYSKQFPDYDKEALNYVLKEQGISYLFFGEEFGARRAENDVYTHGIDFTGERIEYVDFSKVQKLETFRRGVRRIENGIERNYTICFMCSEKQPYDCHRCVMVGDYFSNQGYAVYHIIDEREPMCHAKMFALPCLQELYKKSQETFYKKFGKILSCSINLLGEMAEEDVIELGKIISADYKSISKDQIIRWLNIKIGYHKGAESHG